MNKQNRKRQRYREQTEGCHWEEGLVIGWKMVKGLISTNRQLQNSHWDVNYSTGNIVNYIVVTMYGARWILELLRGTLSKVYDCLTATLYI